ncbi:alpha,alpha-trehalose-phosphate synthase (UDP-forming) [Marinithermus hydrothermalis]|uniref:Alpha,alpha-trehalose-phosphate synthase (UDP-forming) n=1 Tax=Marinithermus hydrothermalis (strain DSM 14884 / JCM 11576 / T1) TaxID=869210 RepID=F2NM30_MARHT|nr:trehalose-6-phosphate synthase [Marinithermus hydrothermalis]AEB11500.1 Alpha,alpha-trehalose-phosphate synthase (UDP-forming) [Marinithermus hydrothermalis DSM 14884]
MGLVIVANREPLREQEGRWVPSVGGLVTALLPVLARRGGVWVAWGDRTARERPTLPYPPNHPQFTVRRLYLSEREVSHYYYGMANRVLWPLAHYFIERTDLRREFYKEYARVNQRFAEATLEVWGTDDTVWVQDYQLMLVPGILRQARPEGRIGYFWHIPWPAVEVWRVLPWARALLRGVLGADVVGFHVEEYAENFLDAARRLLGAEVRDNLVCWEGRRVRIEAHPIGIDTRAYRHLSYDPKVRAEAQRIRREAGTEHILLGVDRLDYTKGILERLLAFERFLQANPYYRGRVTFYQVATPSRTRVESYRALKREIDEIVGRINGSFMRDGWVPVRYLYRAFTREQLAAFYRAADVALITPLRDGMNLVAQEFVAASEDGILVLSDLAGAAQVLPEALHVNPYDIEGVAQAIREAIRMPMRERYARISALKQRVEALDVHGWARRFLESLEV